MPTTISKNSLLGIKFAYQLKIVGLQFVQEHRFHPVRRWRFDFANLDKMIAVEIDGGTYVGGRHTRGKGYHEDCDKRNAAILLGWRVFNFTGKHVHSGEALKIIEQAMGRCY